MTGSQSRDEETHHLHSSAPIYGHTVIDTLVEESTAKGSKLSTQYIIYGVIVIAMMICACASVPFIWPLQWGELRPARVSTRAVGIGSGSVGARIVKPEKPKPKVTATTTTTRNGRKVQSKSGKIGHKLASIPMVGSLFVSAPAAQAMDTHSASHSNVWMTLMDMGLTMDSSVQNMVGDGHSWYIYVGIPIVGLFTFLAYKNSSTEEESQEEPEEIDVAYTGTMQEWQSKEFSVPTRKIQDMLERKNVSILEELGGIQHVTTALNTNVETGLDSSKVAQKREEYGINKLPPKEKVTFWGLCADALEDPMLKILIVAAIVSIVFGVTLPDPATGKVESGTGWIEGAAILVSVALVTFVSAWNDFKKAEKFEELNDQQNKRDVDVIRNGETVPVDVSELVVGDVLKIYQGQRIEVDGLYIQGQDLEMDESAMTGETDSLPKDSKLDPFLLSGTNVSEGAGRMLVIGVGVNSMAGKLSLATQGVPAETPLQVKLTKLADQIGILGLVGASATFALLSAKQAIAIEYGGAAFNLVDFLNYLLVSIALIVVAIPEGLPLAVTLSLAYSMQAMLKDNCLVRNLASCETMAGTNMVCSDKTGTLTTNRMTVVQGWVAGSNFVMDGYGVEGASGATSTAFGLTPQLSTAEDNVALLCKAISFNSTGVLVEGAWLGGNKTEHGLLDFVKACGRDYEEIRNSLASGARRTFPFSSSKKRMTTVVHEDGHEKVFVSGASEWVLDDSTHFITENGERKELTSEIKVTLEDTIKQMATQGNRTIGVAYATEPHTGEVMPQEEPNPSLTLLGVMGIQDPIREEVPGVIKKLRGAGMDIKMVTGDNIYTATAIAEKCGLVDKNKEGTEDIIMEGAEFRELAARDPEALVALIPKLKVLARSSPTDKLTLVASLMEDGNMVAVTGDGTNDAPALKLADVGFAMRSGTDIATGASDMVLMDDNFASVGKATMWGRTVNDNINKFLQFQLTANVAGVFITVIGALISANNTEPLNPVQLLWLNLIMDTLAALALSTEAPMEECFDRPPAPRSTSLISKRMWVFIFGHAAVQLGIMYSLLQHGHVWFDIPMCGLGDEMGQTVAGHCQNGLVHHTMVFNIFILFQLFNMLNARKVYGERNVFSGLEKSRVFLAIWALCAGVQVFAVEFGGQFMGTTHLTAEQWAICMAIALVELPVGFLLNLFPVENNGNPTKEENNKFLGEQKQEAITKAKMAAGMIKG